uniref:Uncharacterized protein n=1 Tax=viral metagenome TaxID=1070528 RepID=A0A6C0DGU8_9ZZZZ
MDASQITKLRQKQNTVVLNRSQTVDSSTMIWRNQIQSSKYIKGVATCTGLRETDVPTEAICPNGNGTFSFGGGGKQMTLATGSTQQYPSVYRGASGSASQTYSSDKILLQKAGRAYCAELITDQDPYTILPKCYTSNTNGPSAANPNPSVNNQDSNPYLPPFDTHYKFKNKLNTLPMPDQNQKHFVKKCGDCVIEPYVPPTHGPWPALIIGDNDNSYVISDSVSYNGLTFTTGTFTGSIRIYNGGITNTTTTDPVITLVQSNTNVQDAFVVVYDKYGVVQWATIIRTRTGVLTQGFGITSDTTGLYISGYFSGQIEYYDGTIYGIVNPVQGTGRGTLTTTNTAALFIIKYNLDGLLQWSTMIDNISANYYTNTIGVKQFAKTGITTNGSQLYVCSYFTAATNVYNANGYSQPTSVQIALTTQNNRQQGLIVQYDTLRGAVQWATRFDSTNTQSTSDALSIVCDAAGVYVGGGFFDTFNYYNTRSTTGTFVSQGTLTNNTLSNTHTSMYVISYSTNGTYQWVNQADSTTINYLSSAISLTLDNAGLYVLVPFQVGLNVYRNPYMGSYGPYTIVTDSTATPETANMAVLKYTINNANIANNGKIAWINKILHIANSSTGVEYYNGFSIVSDSTSVFITGGIINSSLILYNAAAATDPSPSVATLNSINPTQVGDIPILDMFLLRYTTDYGVLQWSTIGGGLLSTTMPYSVSSDYGLVMVSGAAVGPITLYNANRLNQPSVVGGTLTPATNATYYSYVVAFTLEGKYIS